MLRFLAVTIGSVALAYLAGAQAFEAWGGRFVPDAALKLDSRAPGPLVNLTERAWSQKDKAGFQRIALPNTQTVLEQEPLAYRALRQRGLYYSTNGDVAKARSLIALSARISRRDSLGQLWLAEDYGRLGKLDKSLGAFDVVVRTQPGAREPAYRMMGAALANREFRQLFVKLARRNPPWLASFIAYNVSEMARPSDLADVIRQVQPLRPGTLPAAEMNVLLARLVAISPIEEAKTLFLSLPDARPGVLTSLNFASTSDAFRYPPFGWDLSDRIGIQAFPVDDGDSPAIEAVVAPGYRGVAARKLLFLRPGTYDWSGTADLGRVTSGTTAQMVLSCYNMPGQWVRTGEYRLSNGANRFALEIPRNCSAQLLALELMGADSQSDSPMTLGDMKLAEQ